MPRLLAMDTSTHRLSVGVGTGASTGIDPVHEGEGGAQASATLIPTALGLLKQAGLELADLDALVFGRGPGSFTGLRTACAVVQGLAYGTRSDRHPHGLPVLAVDTLLAMAEDARLRWVTTPDGAAHNTPLTITALLDARMDEMYAATYVFADPRFASARLVSGPWLIKPEQLGSLLSAEAACGLWVGNVFEVYGPRLPATAARQLPAWPTAAALLRLAPGLLAQGLATPAAHAQPLYVRDKVAQTTVERALLAQTAPSASAATPA